MVQPRPQAFSAVNIFSKLIGQHVERERLLEELRRSNEYLTNFALTDSLTGLPHRRALHGELGRLLAHAAQDESYVIVEVVDLDDFKRINDSYGHVVGDHFLSECAKRLAGMGPWHRDGEPQELHDCHGRTGVFLRSAEPMATRQQREYESPAASVLPQR